MTPIQFAFLKEGWIQIGGADIPVFFKYEGDNDPNCPNCTAKNKYPFHVIFTIDDHAYYQLYNEWVNKELCPADKIPVRSLVDSAFEHLRTTSEMFHIGIMQWISDFYFHKSRTDYKNSIIHIKESKCYEEIYKHLQKQKQESDAKATLLKQIITKTKSF